ncbi:MAG: hypothetical protein O8C61_04600 [Candidatus Methanoperedens sp.]|nr:hypothetical protein [Candidatus Methanoperedens sp.]
MKKMVSTNPLNEIEQEMCSYLLNLDDMNYTMLCEPLVSGSKSNSMSEMELQRCSYLLNVDDMNYTMLCEPLITRYKSDMSLNISDIAGLEKISLVNGLVCKEDSLESMELIGTQGQMEFPKRKFQQVRPATLEDEIADSSY